MQWRFLSALLDIWNAPDRNSEAHVGSKSIDTIKLNFKGQHPSNAGALAPNNQLFAK
jgi:hypothetical protein